MYTFQKSVLFEILVDHIDSGRFIKNFCLTGTRDQLATPSSFTTP